MFRKIAEALDKGIFKPNRVRVIPKGLDGVPEGLQLLKDNKVSAEKLVYRIAETPGLDE
jgi:hypothetical protein